MSVKQEGKLKSKMYRNTIKLRGFPTKQKNVNDWKSTLLYIISISVHYLGKPPCIIHTFCQAQPQLQVKLSWKAELALFSINPTSPLQPGKVYFPTFLSECWSSKVTGVGRRPQFLWKRKTTSIYLEMEDNLHLFRKW